MDQQEGRVEAAPAPASGRVEGHPPEPLLQVGQRGHEGAEEEEGRGRGGGGGGLGRGDGSGRGGGGRQEIPRRGRRGRAGGWGVPGETEKETIHK